MTGSEPRRETVTIRTNAPLANRARKGPRVLAVLGVAATLALLGTFVSGPPIETQAAGPSRLGGPVLAWGDNANGQLGNANTTNSSAPVAVSLPSGTNATAIAGGMSHSLAIT